MPSPARLVINTSPLLACIAGCGSLSPLESLYEELLVPKEVAEEIEAGGSHRFGLAEFSAATWLRRWPARVEPMPLLRNSLDRGKHPSSNSPSTRASPPFALMNRWAEGWRA